MKFGSLFSGIGGIDLGLERAGMKCVWQVEVDPWCQKVLQKRWPEVQRYIDIKDVGKQNLEPVDLICGGFPCQPHSVAGRRRASSDERDLWPQFARIIRELKPRWVLAENVPGLLSSENGRFFGRILRDLAISGYDAEWQSVPAAAFGAPHIRERVFIVAYSNSNGCRWNRQQPRGSNPYGSIEEKVCGGQNQEDQKNKGSESYSFGSDVANSNSFGFQNWGKTVFKSVAKPSRSDWWSIEPKLGRMVNGVPNQMDRLRGLGNAVVPQVVEWIGTQITVFDKSQN